CGTQDGVEVVYDALVLRVVIGSSAVRGNKFKQLLLILVSSRESPLERLLPSCQHGMLFELPALEPGIDSSNHLAVVIELDRIDDGNLHHTLASNPALGVHANRKRLPLQ